MKKGFFAAFLDLLFPPKCIFCRRVLRPCEKDCCAECEKTLPRCEDAPRTGSFFTACCAPLYYEDAVRKAILRFKFGGSTNYAAPFGKYLADCVRRNFAGQYDLVTWVPVSRDRKKSRGYDQAMLLAMATCLELDDVAVETLRKVIDNPAQSGLETADERRANVIGAYEVTDPAILAGQRILLIDDIITTGSTLSECSRTLLTAGAASVVCAALARTREKTTASRKTP